MQEWLGHADIEITANVYGHLDISRKKRDCRRHIQCDFKVLEKVLETVIFNEVHKKTKKPRKLYVSRLFRLVGVTGFEPMASWSRTKRDTKLRHTPIFN